MQHQSAQLHACQWCHMHNLASQNFTNMITFLAGIYHDMTSYQINFRMPQCVKDRRRKLTDFESGHVSMLYMHYRTTADDRHHPSPTGHNSGKIGWANIMQTKFSSRLYLNSSMDQNCNTSTWQKKKNLISTNARRREPFSIVWGWKYSTTPRTSDFDTYLMESQLLIIL